MKRIGWSLPRFSSFKTSKRRGLRNSLVKSEVLEVRSLMSATNSSPVVEEPGDGGEDSAENLDDGTADESNPDVIFYTLGGAVAPPAVSNFTSREELGDYLLERALERYSGLFGQPQWYQGPIYYRGGAFLADDAVHTAMVDHSETNVQVDGVDEGDLIENDGQHLFVINGNDLLIMQAYPANQMQELSRIRFDGYAIAEYLDGDRLTVISQEYNYGGVGGGLFFDAIRFAPSSTTTIVSTFDVSDPSKPILDKQTSLDGYYVDSRAFNGQVHVITSNDLALPAPQTDGTTTIDSPIYYFGGPIGRPIFLEDAVVSGESLNITATEDDPVGDAMGEKYELFTQQIEVPCYESREAYIARVRANLVSLIDSVLPRYESLSANGLGVDGAISEVSAIARVNDAASSSLLSVVSIDTRGSQPGLVSSSSVLADWTNGIYANQEHLYVFSPVYDYESSTTQTRILEFAWANDEREIELLASGIVDGSLHNQFSADEFEGRLRIATTTFSYDSATGTSSQANNLTILENIDGVLTSVGSVDGFADREQIYSVRFDGDRAFVVTFRQIDPLFVFDLSDATAPEIVGELEVPGYSSYLQVIDENHLLAVGRSTDSQATKVALYDISNPEFPFEIDEDILPSWTWSIAEWDSKAIGWFASKETLAIPASSYNWETGYHNELFVFHVDVNQSGESAIQLNGIVSDDGYINRSAYIENVLYTISSNSVIATDIDDPSQQLGRFDIQYLPYVATLNIEPVFTETDDGASDWEYIDVPETMEDAENMLVLAAVNVVTGQVRVSLLEEGGTIAMSLRGDELRISKPGHGYQTVPLDGTELLQIDGTSTNDRVNIDLSRGDSPNLAEILLNGLEGADRLTVSAVNQSYDGSVVIDGGDGNDSITVATSVQHGVQLLGGDGNDSLFGGSGDDTADGGAGRDDLRGGAGNDLLRGGDDNDTLSGGNGDDTLGGGAGHDRLNGGNGNDAMSGGDGNDSIYGGNGDDTLLGGDGNDLLRGEVGKDLVLGGEGNDNVYGGATNGDTVSGGTGNDIVRGLKSEIVNAFTFSAEWLDRLDA